MVNFMTVAINLGLLFAIFYGMLWGVRKYKRYKSRTSIGEVKDMFPVSYKSNAYVIRYGSRYFLCVENCGMQEITDPDMALRFEKESLSFSKMLAEEYKKASSFSVKDMIGKYKNSHMDDKMENKI